MPHDKNGRILKAGDRVLVQCTVKEVQPAGDFCNLTLMTDEPMPGNVSETCDGKTCIVLNAKQVVAYCEGENPDSLGVHYRYKDGAETGK